MTGPRIGSLFSGYGGLDMGVMAAIGGEVAWHVEYDKAPSRILAHHWPDIPNFGDVTTTDWSSVPPVDVLTGGFPCQDVSLAGRRAGLTNGTRSGLWSEYARAIDVLKPQMVVIENVRGLLSAQASGALEPDPWGMGDGATRPVVNALGVVLGDLASLGYDAKWCGLRAADAGAPHGRYRVFLVAHPPHIGHERPRPSRDGWKGPEDRNASTADAECWRIQRERNDRNMAGSTEAPRRPLRHVAGDASPLSDGGRWGKFGPAIDHWSRLMTREAPEPTKADGREGAERLNASFVEWMMGLPEGHVTNVGLDRSEQLKALGNGVVPQQAELAIRALLAA